MTMDSASPTATVSTNRGGRPKDWTEPRTRRLIRLYLYTTLSLHQILELLEEDDFKPGKDAANKVKNSVLGNDPRWIRPKDDDDEKTRVRALRNSLRGRRPRPDPASREDHSPPYDTFSPEDAPLGDQTFTHQYQPSANDFYYTNSASSARPGITYIDPHSTTVDDGASSRFFPGLIGRFSTSRNDTGLTASTDISIASALKAKLTQVPVHKAKRAVKVLKRYTFPKNLDAQRCSDAPSSTPFGPSSWSPANRIADLYSAAYAVPGDFLNTNLFARQQQCASTAPAHAAGICWCKVAGQIQPMTRMWAMFPPLDQNLATKDEFGNTAFHHLAAKEGNEERFLHYVWLALQKPDLPLREVNTAGQTFLHVLHHSWFQAGSRLDDLLDTLRTGNFDLFARDVYGRSFFHMLPANSRSPARFPGPGPDFYRANCRDAFGRKPMDITSAPEATRRPFHNQATQRGSAMIPTRINTQAGALAEEEIYDHTNMLRIMTEALGAFDISHSSGPEEDAQGRNAFHCLAEVSFDLAGAATKRNPRAPPQDDSRLEVPAHYKRKHHDEEVEKPRTTSDSPRLGFFEGLVLAGVDANHYDKSGNTPLMSFVLCSSDVTKYDKDESEMIIKLLVQKAGVKLESRNKNGETALHLAARRGKTIALKTLLDLGANPNTRNAQGLGILEVVDRLFINTECDDKNNARYEAARAILTRKACDTKQSPTLAHEWAIRKTQ